ncbi:MAG: D-aminoacyl-tRNA deacylase [Candidatus Methanomethylophilaceae archaeon]|nr:D-aminoacyl-tRNA deacylase [Candidatus Methanomethylophilaceae archaeon]
MRTLLVCSEPDAPSVNMKAALLRKEEWESAGSDGDASYLISERFAIMTIPELHIYAEGADSVARRTVDFDNMVFLSRHKASSGIPTLPVHPIGNYRTADFGGKDETLCPASPHMMSATLRAMQKLNDTDIYTVSFEVTHHGPYTETPAFFIEIGSDEGRWGDLHAAEILTDALLQTETDDSNIVAIGIGGGHYAPRFSEAALSYRIDFGHMIPKYQIDGADEDEMVRMLTQASEMTGTKIAYIHRKSLKGPEERRIRDLVESQGMETVSSKDLDPINPR